MVGAFATTDRGTAVAVAVAAGTTPSGDFAPAHSTLSLNIHDTEEQSGAAVLRGEATGRHAMASPAEPTTDPMRPVQRRELAP